VSESVDILIKAEDMATPVVAKAAKSVDALDVSIKKFKTSGEQAKKSTEFFGSIANALGGSELGGYASQLAGLTEKTSQFAEVQKLGGAGAFAFKAGLVAAAGALSFQVGTALGNVIFETEKWTKKLAEATAESDRFLNALLELKQFNFSQNKEEITLLRDPDKQLAATKELLASTQKEIEDKSKQITAILKAEAKTRSEEEQWGADWFGAGSDRIASVEREVSEGNKMLEVLRSQARELERATSETTLANKELAKKNALLDKSDDYLKTLREEIELLRVGKDEQISILALRNAIGDAAQEEAKALLLEKQTIQEREAANQKAIQEQESITKGSESYVKSLRDQLELLKATDAEKAGVQAGQKAVGGDVATATGLLKEIEAITSLAEFEKMREAELQKIQGEKEADAKRLADLKQSELDRLAEEMILLKQGAEAAKAFKLQKQGLSEADAKSIARQEAELEKLKEAKKPGANIKQDIPELKAFESRLLTRGGSGEDPAKATARNTLDMYKEMQILNRRFAEERKQLLSVKVVKK